MPAPENQGGEQLTRSEAIRNKVKLFLPAIVLKSQRGSEHQFWPEGESFGDTMLRIIYYPHLQVADLQIDTRITTYAHRLTITHYLMPYEGFEIHTVTGDVSNYWQNSDVHDTKDNLVDPNDVVIDPGLPLDVAAVERNFLASLDQPINEPFTTAKEQRFLTVLNTI